MKLKHPRNNLPIIGALLGVAVLSLVVVVFVFRASWENRNLTDVISPGKARDVVLVFHHPDGKKETLRKVKVDKTATVAEQIKYIIKYMTVKPIKSSDDTLWPMQLPVRTVYLRNNGLLILDFEKSVQYNQIIGVVEEVTAIQSLIVTLYDAFDEIKRIKFLVGGQEVETLAGHIDISRDFDKNVIIEEK